MNTITIEGKVRSTHGTKATDDLRREGMVPCNLYGKDLSVSFYAPATEFKKLVFSQEFNKVIVKLDNGNSYEAISKDYQWHPISDNLLHVDFLHLSDRKVNVTVPIRFVGNPEGVKAGGKLVIKTRRIKYKALPKDLVDHITLDISHLGLGKIIRVRDIAKLDGIEIGLDGGMPVASIAIPRAMKSAETAAAKEAKKK